MVWQEGRGAAPHRRRRLELGARRRVRGLRFKVKFCLKVRISRVMVRV